MEISRVSFDWLRNLWIYTDIEIRITSYALTAIFVTDECGRDILFSPQNRLEESHLIAIMLDEDECSFVKEQVKILYFDFKIFDIFEYRCVMY